MAKRAELTGPELAMIVFTCWLLGAASGVMCSYLFWEATVGST